MMHVGLPWDDDAVRLRIEEMDRELRMKCSLFFIERLWGQFYDKRN